MNNDGFIEANQLLSLALEELSSVVSNGNWSSMNEEINNNIDKENGEVNGNGRNEVDGETQKNPAILNWDSNVNNWNGGTQSVENGRDSATSSSLEESPPTSSMSSTHPNAFRAFLRAIDNDEIHERPDLECQFKIMNWLRSRHRKSPSPSMSTVSCPEYPELQEKLHRLAMARDSLSLQVSVLTEQVGAQKEKIRDLEDLLASKRNKLDSTEELLQEKSMNRGDLESKKLDLMAEVSNLKLKYATLEREKFETERKLRLSQAEIEHLNQSMQGFMAQYGLQPQFKNAQDVVPYAYQHAVINDSVHRTNEANKRDSEIEQLRMVVQRLIADNEQKNLHINSLRSALDEQCRSENEINRHNSSIYAHRGVNGCSGSTMNGSELPLQQPFDINAQIRKLLREDYNDHIAHSSSFPNNFYNSQLYPNHSDASRTTSAIQSSSSYTSSLSAASPQHTWSTSGTPRHQPQQVNSNSNPSNLPPPSSGSGMPTNNYRAPSSPAARQLAAELDELRRLGGEIQQKHDDSLNNGDILLPLKAKAASTLMLSRKKLASNVSSGISGEFPLIIPNSDASVSVSSRQSRRSYRQQMNKWLHEKILSRVDKRSTSAPNLGPCAIEILCSDEDGDGDDRGSIASEYEMESDDEVMRGRQSRLSDDKFKRGRTRSSLKNLLVKLTRSTSQEMRAGGLEKNCTTQSVPRQLHLSTRLASVGPVSGAVALRPAAEQFVDWNADQLCEWMAEIGFSAYVPEVARFVRNGRHLLNMTNQEFEKELMMKNVLHRKRLRCILNIINRGGSETFDRMDVHQVLQWLDDIGIPQYRENFTENMVDGLMLTILTAQDLMEMKISSAMHHATIARGIQFLKSSDFTLSSIERRFSSDVIHKGPCPNLIERWSHHCVCQWLKAIDLAEFTPNLFCAGVHGALMVYEPTFTAESLAEVLQIPSHKTLLRRHLATHFNQLLGQDIVSHKRSILAQPCVTQLAPSLKIRLLKKGFSLARKKGKSEVYVEPDELVCPPMNSKSKFTRRLSEDYLESLTSSNV